MTEPRRWQTEADRLAHASVERGDPTGWFEQLYAAGESGEVTMAWDHDDPHPLLAHWADITGPGNGPVRGDCRRAVVVGTGLGAEAEFVASLGFDTTAFDLSPTAIRTARGRHTGSVVDYHVADLFDLPSEWAHAFDLVVEVYTVQALPRALRARAVAAIADLVATGGTLVAIQVIHDGEGEPSGPPWPLTRGEIESFTRAGLREVSLEEVRGEPGWPHWLATFTRGRTRVGC